MPYENICFETEGQLALITLNRPNRRNALSLELMGLAGAEFSRGYIQSWGQGQAINERSTQRILHAADQILRAGRPQPQLAEQGGN